MKTIKLKLVNRPDINYYTRLYNNIVKYSFNRFKDIKTEKDIRSRCKTLFPKENSWFIQCAVKTGQELFNLHGNKKIVFGGRKNLIRYLKGLITKDEFKTKRLFPLTIQGEKLHKGNRLFNFELEDNRIIFKPCRRKKIEIDFIPPNKNYKEELQCLQMMINNKEITITVSINDDYIYLTYDESLINNKKLIGLKQNRILGIDLNPNYIGISILKFYKNDEFVILYKQVFDLTKITKKNKKKFELHEINKKIIKLCNYWKVSTIAVEKLNIKNSPLNKGRNLNKLCINDWCRCLTIKNLKLQCSIHRIKFVEINPAYSSQVGNILYGNKNTPDMVASSIEIARRGYKKFEKGWFYPDFNKVKSLLNEQWKQTLKDYLIKDWEELFSIIKNLKLKYRVPLTYCLNNKCGLSFNHIKSRVLVYNFV